MTQQIFDKTRLRRSPKTRARILTWIAALQSGKYKKARHRLRNVKGLKVTYCCLGVACDVLAPTKWSSPGGGHAFGQDNSLLDVETTRLLGLKGGKTENAGQRLLAVLNDNGASFQKIAAKLAREYKEALA